MLDYLIEEARRGSEGSMNHTCGSCSLHYRTVVCAVEKWHILQFHSKHSKLLIYISIAADIRSGGQTGAVDDVNSITRDVRRDSERIGKVRPDWPGILPVECIQTDGTRVTQGETRGG
jgi:hypothetical protein